MRGTELATYQSWEDLGYQRCSEADLIKEIQQYSRDSVLWVCSYINIFLRDWDRTTSDSSVYFGLIRHFYSPKFALRLWAAYYNREQKRLVFHRRQLLYLCKLAIAYCPTNGLKAGIPANGFGTLLLKANDLLHFDIIPQKPFDSCSADDLSKYIAELQAVSEYSNHLGSENLVRAHKLFLEIPQQIDTHPDFVDLQSSLQESVGLNYLDIFSLTIGLASRYFSLQRETVDREPFQLTIPSTYLNSLSFPKNKVARYLDLITTSALSLQKKASENHLANDMTILRQFPLMEYWYDVGTVHQKLAFIPIDLEFLLDKTYSAPFWFLYQKHGLRFARFWGVVFEKYVNDLLEKSRRTASSLLIPNPSSPQDANQELCDCVIIDGESIVLIESKATLLRADIKYSGDASGFAAHIKSRFVRNAAENRPKGVSQLAKAASVLFGKDKKCVPWADLSRIKRCYYC